MSVEVRVPTLLRRHTSGQASVTASGSTLDEVFADLASQFPDLGAQLRGPDGGLHKFMNVYVNDDDVRFLGKLQAPIKAGDEVTILPAVAGG